MLARANAIGLFSAVSLICLLLRRNISARLEGEIHRILRINFYISQGGVRLSARGNKCNSAFLLLLSSVFIVLG